MQVKNKCSDGEYGISGMHLMISYHSGSLKFKNIKVFGQNISYTHFSHSSSDYNNPGPSSFITNSRYTIYVINLNGYIFQKEVGD